MVVPVRSTRLKSGAGVLILTWVMGFYLLKKVKGWWTLH
jgi:hypothetical protein